MKPVSTIIAAAALSTVAFSANAQNLFSGFTTNLHFGVGTLQTTSTGFILNNGGPVIFAGAAASTGLGQSTLTFGINLSQRLTANRSDSRGTGYSANLASKYIALSSPISMGKINKVHFSMTNEAPVTNDALNNNHFETYRAGVSGQFGKLNADASLAAETIAGFRGFGYMLGLGGNVFGGQFAVSYNNIAQESVGGTGYTALGVSYDKAVSYGTLGVRYLNNRGSLGEKGPYLGLTYIVSTRNKSA